jgi:predicted nucleotidyltransferase
MSEPLPSLDRRRLEALCLRHGIARLALFGSVLRPDFRPESDVDVLVDFLPGRAPSLFGFAGLQTELTELFGRQAHLHTAAMIAPDLRDKVTGQASLQYAA